MAHALGLPDGGRLTALLDDDNLPAGDYEIRGHAVDAVGNERTLALRRRPIDPTPGAGGLQALRRYAEADPTKPGTALDPRPSVRFGARVPIHGRVTDAFGDGRANVAVEVSERLALPGVAWRPITTLTTDKNGSFTYTAPKGVARTIRFQYAGHRHAGRGIRSRVARARGFDAEPSRRTLRNGDTVVLRGRLLGRPIPSTGKLVTVQAWTPRGWLTFGNARARRRTGEWSYRYTFTGTTATSRYRFRAVVPRRRSYPYVAGTSPTVAVAVRGCGGRDVNGAVTSSAAVDGRRGERLSEAATLYAALPLARAASVSTFEALALASRTACSSAQTASSGAGTQFDEDVQTRFRRPSGGAPVE